MLEQVERALRGSYHQYALMAGSMALRTAIAGKLAALYSVKVDPVAEITVTSGATEAIFDAIQAVVRRDDEVIVFDPCYDSYEPSITLAGGRTVHLPLTQPGFAIDWERLRAALNSRTRLVIVNSPHNPSGALLKRADFDRLAELLRPYDCYLLATRFTSTSCSTARGTRRRWRSRSLRSVALPFFRSARPITRRGGSSATASRRRRCRRSCGACTST